jgi:hypothetical protein
MTDIVLAPAATIETATDATAIAPQRPYVEPKRLDVPAGVVRELLQAAGLGTGCAKATLVVQPTYSTNAAALSWCEGNKDEVVVLTRAAGRWEAQELAVLSPWCGAKWSGDIGQNVAIVVYKHRGVHGWVEIVVAPDSAFLGGIELPTEAPAMSEGAAVVLRILDGLKASYRPNAYARNGIGPAALAATIEELKRLGFVTVNRAGNVGLTMPGKNAARLLPRMLGL